MNVADEKIIQFDHIKNRLRAPSHVSTVYAEQKYETGHDSRGFVMAVGLCIMCWAVLGYYLLA